MTLCDFFGYITLRKDFVRTFVNTYQAVYENGVFRPIQKVDLEDGENVEITISVVKAKDPAESILDIAIDCGIPDFATNIDYYLYGLPKQSEK